MRHTDLVIRGARIVTPKGPARGRSMSDLHIIECGDVGISGGVIAWIARSPGDTTAPSGQHQEMGAVIEAHGRVLIPGFVDSHTHAMWAGDRLDEWEQKRAGATYLQILQSGGGIMSTVRAVRQTSPTQLEQHLADRLAIMLSEGSTTVEVKSGYGLTTRDELKMLRATQSAASRADMPTVVATALLGHALDADLAPDQFIRSVIGETLPAVHAEFPGITIDAYCEKGAWSLEACIELFDKAMSLGHPVRVHTDQFNSLGMTEWAIAHGAMSVDHLEASTPATIQAIARSTTTGVFLPCAGFHTDGRYADGRTLIDAGGGVAIATNCNPGSAPSSSMPMAMALAVRNNGLTPAEAVCAATSNGASVLGFADRGAIVEGNRADLVLLRHRDERMLAFEFGGDPVEFVICSGKVVRD